MTLPLQQVGEPISARKVRLPLYGATPEPEILSQGFYAAEVEEGLGVNPFASCHHVITRRRDTSAKDHDGLNGCFSPYGTARGYAKHEG